MVVRPADKRKFPFGWVVAGLLVGTAIYFGVKHLPHGADAGAQAQGQGMPVNAAAVVSKSITRWSEFSGRIEAVNATEIHPQVGGLITAIYFKDGDEVKRGQKLFTIDPRPYEAQAVAAKGAEAAAEAAYANAVTDFKRAKQLIGMKAISKAEFEQRSNGLRQAEGNWNAAKGASQAAAVNLSYTQITAPLSGRISRAEITQGNLVEAGANAPLLASIVSLSPLYASFELDEQTFLNTIQGVPQNKLKTVPVEIGLSSEQGTPHAAAIHSFDNQLSASSGTIRVRALVENKDQSLVPGLFARVRIGAPDQLNAMLVNPSAIGTDQSKKFVMLVGEGNKAEYREVKLGQAVDGLQMITEGLKEGDRVVVSNLQKLRPGVPLSPTEVDMTTLQPAGGATPAAATPAPEAK